MERRVELYNKVTGEVYGRVLTNHSMTIEEYAYFCNVKIMKTEDDYMNGDGVDYEELDTRIVEAE